MYVCHFKQDLHGRLAWHLLWATYCVSIYIYIYYIYVSIYIYAFNHHKCVFVSMLWLGFCSAGVITIVFVFTSVVSFCSFGSPEPLLALELLCKVPVHT